jgi:hypothetical protein
MKRTTFTLLSAVILILLLLSSPLLGFAADDRHAVAIDRALKASSLSRTEQAEVHARAASAISAGVPAEDVEVIVTRATGRGMDAGIINRFLDLGASAKKDGLPVGPVLDRIEQGLSKGVPAERIQVASDRLAQKLAEARSVVDGLIRAGIKPRAGAERDAAIASSARALEKNMTSRDIEKIGAAVQGKKGSLGLLSGAVDTAAYFTGSGMQPKTASRLVGSAIEKGYSARDLDSLVKRMDNEMRRGMKAEDIATKMEREGMKGEREMERQEMQQEMKGGHGSGSGPSGMGGMGGMGGRGR